MRTLLLKKASLNNIGRRINSRVERRGFFILKTNKKRKNVDTNRDERTDGNV